MIGQVCGKVATIGENCKSVQNLSKMRITSESILIVAIETSQLPGGTEYGSQSL